MLCSNLVMKLASMLFPLSFNAGCFYGACPGVPACIRDSGGAGKS